MKLAAQKLDAMPQLGRDFVSSHAVADLSVERMLPEVDVDDLRAAWADIMKRARLNQHHHITREQLSVRDHMTHILRRLNDVRFMEFGDLFMERIREGARGRGRRAFHRHARAGPRIAAGDHAGRALRADLRAPGLRAWPPSRPDPPAGCAQSRRIP